MSIFVFPRRELQRSIERLAAVLESDQLESIIARLNRPGDARLPAMWELVMLDALARVGVLRHEVELSGGRRPDIELTVSQPEGATLSIFGDVASVSDAGLDEQNPVGVLRDELSRLATKAGLNPNHFGYTVSGGHMGAFGDGRMKLFLPPKGQLLELMNRVVTPWINSLKADPGQSDRFNCEEQEIRFSLTYDPTQRYAHGNHLSYDIAASLDKNPLFRALKGKVSQLRQAPWNALRLIIACDGDCALLRQRRHMRTHGTFSASEVAEDFLRQNSSIDAVLLVSIEELSRYLHSETTFQMGYELVIAPTHARSQRMTPAAISALQAILEEAVSYVPRPIRTAYNAAIRCQLSGSGPDMIGGYKMTDNSISLSSRALQRLLAGEMTVDEFDAAHGWNDVSGPRNPFARAVCSGRLIRNIEIEEAGDADDDWLTFTFGPPDPAAAPFTVPDIASQFRTDDSKNGPLPPPEKGV